MSLWNHYGSYTDLAYGALNDTPGRVGISEIRYVEGLIAFWDELKRRFPHLLFDIVQRRDLTSLGRTLDKHAEALRGSQWRSAVVSDSQ